MMYSIFSKHAVNVLLCALCLLCLMIIGKKMIITIAVLAGSPVENPGEGEEGARGGGVLVQLVRPQLLR